MAVDLGDLSDIFNTPLVRSLNENVFAESEFRPAQVAGD